MSAVFAPSRAFRDAHDQECTAFTDAIEDGPEHIPELPDTESAVVLRCATLEAALYLKRIYPNRIVIVSSC